MHVLVLGAGQLARMMALAGAPLNIQISSFDVGSGNIVHPLTLTNLGHGLDNAIKQADVITAEFEHIPHDVLELCRTSTSNSPLKKNKFFPTTEAIKIGGDRRLEKALLDKAGVKNAKHHIINHREDFEQAIESIGLPMVLKSTLGGYDGKGQWRLKTPSEAETVWSEIELCLTETEQQAIVAEAFIPFDREVSLIGVRAEDGETAVYPVTENIHTNGILSLSTAITDPKLQNQAKQMFNRIAETLNYVGVLAVEFFDVGGELLVNEIAPRVHNSGHWTQQGAEVCQFENHLRAICGLPLGATRLIRPTAMINIIGEDSLPDDVLRQPACHIHWYGKDKRPGRKMGHINVTADSVTELNKQLLMLSEILDKNAFPALKPLAL